MIDFSKIRERPTAWTVSKEFIANGLQLFLILYGLKCILFLHGKMLLSIQGTIYSHLELKPVAGATAVMAGSLYFGFGLFIFLSDGHPPGEDRGWVWRIGRALLRWGSLAIALFCFFQLPKDGSPNFLSVYDLIIVVGFIAGFIALMLFLFAMFQREQVKRELRGRGCQPLHSRWRPAEYWLSWQSYWGATGFRVVYLDPNGFTHKGYCFVYRSFLQDWQRGNRRVQWLADTVTGQSPAPEVWADGEIIRPKLTERDSSAEANNWLENPDEPPA